MSHLPARVLPDSAVRGTVPVRHGSFHSSYDPRKEADRHVAAILGTRIPSLVFIVGGGCNYLGASVRKSVPGALVVLVQLAEGFERCEIDSGDERWSPALSGSLSAFLEGRIPESATRGGIAIIEWAPVCRTWPDEHVRCMQEIRMFMERTSSARATEAYWARRWLVNSLRFAVSAQNIGSMTPIHKPVVIACAGPGLNASLEELVSGGIQRTAYALWSLASAYRAVRHAGFQPDLILSTDPGYWNGAHHDLSAEKSIPLAMPPGAYAPVQVMQDRTLIPLDTGLAFERVVLHSMGLQGYEVPACGSVAGTSLELALSVTDGAVALAGYDLAAYRLHDHARPYAFDIFDELAASRLAPAVSGRSGRIFDAYPGAEDEWRFSRAFSLYADSIGTRPSGRGRVFRVSASPVKTPLVPLPKMSDIPGLATPVMCSEPAGTGAGAVPFSLPSGWSAEKIVLSLKDRAIAAMERSIAGGLLPDNEESIVLLALAGRSGALFLAEAARGKPTGALLDATLPAMDDTIGRLSTISGTYRSDDE